MENQDFNHELLDYLYGEMSEQERKEFERKLQVDSKLQEEYKELAAIRDDLGKLKDKEIMEPFSAWGRPRTTQWWAGSHRRKIIVFRPVTAVAASLVILFMVGYFTNFSLSLTEDGFKLGFGQQMANSSEKYFTEDEVLAIVDREMQKNNEKLLARLEGFEESNNIKLASLEDELSKVKSSGDETPLTRDDIQQYFASAENKNAESVKEYLKLTSAQQQEFLTAMFNQFNNFYQQQRDDDLALIQNTIYDISQNQALHKQETEKAIAQLYTSVSQKDN